VERRGEKEERRVWHQRKTGWAQPSSMGTALLTQSITCGESGTLVDGPKCVLCPVWEANSGHPQEIKVKAGFFGEVVLVWVGENRRNGCGTPLNEPRCSTYFRQSAAPYSHPTPNHQKTQTTTVNESKD